MPDRIVVVDWFDAHEQSGWITECEVKGPVPAEIRSVGAIIRKGPDGIVIASSKSDDGVFGGVRFIPQQTIRKITPLEMTLDIEREANAA